MGFQQMRKRCELYLEMFVDNKVFVLDIAVGNTMAVQIIDCIYNLRKNIPRLVLRQALVLRLLDAFKQIVRRTARVLWSWRVEEW
jgi:hypothetical protein